MKFFSILRNRHDLVYKLLTLSKGRESKESLATFIMQFFYENIFSSSFIENELLLIIYLSLQNEINLLPSYINNESQSDTTYNSNITTEDVLTHKNELFQDSINHYLFKNLLRKTDIKSYFGIVLKDIISQIETKKDSHTLLTFKIYDIYNEFNEKKKELSNSSLSKNRRATRYVPTIPTQQLNNQVDMDVFLNMSDDEPECGLTPDLADDKVNKKEHKHSQNQDHFKTCVTEIKIEELELLEKNTTHKGMKQYLNQHIKNLKEDGTIYQNKTFICNVCKIPNNSNELCKIYQNNFNTAVNVIEMLFDNLNNNYRIIPYSIKCISKMISILIKKKYPHLSIVEHNKYRFIFF